MSMFGKLFAWLMNDVIVHTLANNKRFQQMAVKMDSSIAKNKKVISEKYLKDGEKIFNENLSKAKKNMPPITNVNPMHFAKSFYKEIRNEVIKAKTNGK
jgi:hypothetical protein